MKNLLKRRKKHSFDCLVNMVKACCTINKNNITFRKVLHISLWRSSAKRGRENFHAWM